MTVPISNPHPLLPGLLSAGAMGVLAGLGPCAAPRLLALTGLTHRESSRNAVLLCGGFTLGNTIVYTAFGCMSSLVLRELDISPYVYATVAVLLIAAGIYVLRIRSHCKHEHRPVTLGSAFLLGITSASIASPCCTPLLFAVLTMASQYDLSPATALLLACYAIGSAAPSILIAALTFRAITRCAETFLMQLRPLQAGLLIGIGIYYGVLA